VRQIKKKVIKIVKEIKTILKRELEYSKGKGNLFLKLVAPAGAFKPACWP